MTSGTDAGPGTGSGTSSGRTRPPKYDPDTVATLEDELALQLRSLDDLKDEFDAGDLDQADYETLRDDYTVRVADTMRSLDQQKDLVEARPRNRFSIWAMAAVVVFAAGAGLLLARSTGERGVNDILTGNIESSRQQIFECQGLAEAGQIVDSLKCFDEVLLQDPDNVEALTYRGWFVILTISSAESSGDTAQAAELLGGGLTYLDRAIEVDPEFPDARAFRAVVFDRLGQSEAACADVATLLALNPPPFFVTQTQGIVDRNNCL